MRKTWRVTGISETYQIARRSDVPAKEREAASPHLALLYVDRWLADPIARQSLLEMYESTGGSPALAGGRSSGYDLHRRIRSRLVEAFQRGDLVIVRSPHVGFVPTASKEQTKTEKAPEAASQERPVPSARSNEQEIYVLALEARTIGETPLVNHKVRILDPDTGRQVGDTILTDDDGIMRAVVPENKQYRIEILDEESEPFTNPIQAYEEPAFLMCRFVDGSGYPFANAKVEVQEDGHTFETATDEDGWIECCAQLGPCELRVEGQVFKAHSLLLKDREIDENHYLFVVSAATTGDDPASEPEGRLPRYDAPLHPDSQEVDV